ncbi:TasA family protein [Radiobacillus sp. PE A8.2]|uniref:TasA family protein n=1 Tax=Radiobacillus sp. PE A8.2 TaxID=3380349 RepID=UPI00388D9A37
MNIKTKLGMGIATGVLALGLIGGGTFAYFSDTAVQTNTFQSGTIVLDVEPEVQVAMENLKPGDWMPRTFELQNNGSLDMKNVDLKTSFKVTRDGQPVVPGLADKYAEQIIVQFMNNTSGDEDKEILLEVSLKDLRDLTPNELATRIDIEQIVLLPGYSFWIPFIGWITVPPVYQDVQNEVSGIAAGETAGFDVQFRFNDTGVAQNDLQNLDLELTWTFEGYQTDGEEK